MFDFDHLLRIQIKPVRLATIRVRFFVEEYFGIGPLGWGGFLASGIPDPSYIGNPGNFYITKLATLQHDEKNEFFQERKIKIDFG